MRISRIMQKYILLFLLSGFFTTATAQEVNISSGFFDYRYFQNDERISTKELVKLLETNPESHEHWKRSRTLKILSYTALAAETGFFLNEILDIKPYENVSNKTVNKIGLYGSFAAVLTFGILSQSQKKKSVATYNKSLEKKTTFTLKPSRSGVGIALVF